MTKLRLHYFDMHGGRGEVARLVLSTAGIEFEDIRIPFPEWPAAKPDTPFGVIPVLEVDGYKLSQSNTINRYVGKLAGLYPSDPLEAAYCDEVMDAVEDVAVKVTATFGMDEQAKKAARTELTAGLLPRYFGRLASMLEERGTGFFAGDSLTVADLKVFLSVRNVKSGNLDYIPASLVDDIGPLREHFDRVNSDARVRAYYDPRGL